MGVGISSGTSLAGYGSRIDGKTFRGVLDSKGGRDGEARTDPHVAPREMETLFCGRGRG